MDIEENIARVEDHLKRHPADYQSVISLLKLKSRAVEKKIQTRRIEKQRKIAECRRILDEKQA